ncbi:MAG TPA: OpgC domain-containing protein [Dehalococcoidia bacterium]|nr:OpgC domain-containing protein [Dehalococcoidia bacterium]
MERALLFRRIRDALTIPRREQWRAWAAVRPASARPVPIERDLRLDFFRGLSLFFIFIDHIPNNVLSYATLHAIAFSDAAEVFIFISGYTAALVYGQLMVRRGTLVATAQIYYRVWQLYVAHIFIFMIYTAEVSYAMLQLQTQTYSEELRLSSFLQEPHIAIVKMMTLQYQPELLDILPLYIVLLAAFPIVLWLQQRRPFAPLALSFTIYLMTLYFGWEPKTYPNNEGWFFNPFAWQFLFLVGATAGYAQSAAQPSIPRWPWLPRAAITVAAAVAAIKLTWLAHGFHAGIPALFYGQLEELADDKSDLSPLRLVSFFALALTTVQFMRRDSAILRNPVSKLVILCGQHSLQVFCLGILLSVLGRFIVSSVSGSIWMQLAVNLAGLALMIALAALMAWYKKKSRPPAAAPVPQAGVAR